MAHANINTSPTVSLVEAAQLIVANPRLRFHLEGEKGIGKSSIMQILKPMLPNHIPVYRDVAQMAEGEAGIPMPNHDLRTSALYPNAGFQLHTGQPVLLMLDELTKGSRYVVNMLHTMLERHNPRFGDLPLPEGSYIFSSGNLSDEGIGDTMPAHTRDRMVVLRVRKPTANEWLTWAANNGIDPIVMAWVNETPHCLASYLDGDQDENPYITNPRRQQLAVVTPRSLDKASDLVSMRHMYSSDSLTAALVGCVGEAAARDMSAFIDYQDQLPRWQEVIDDPKNTRLPTSPGACAVMVFGAVSRITRETMDAAMVYVSRLDPTWQATFAVSVAKNPERQSIAFSSKAFAEWMLKNEDLL